MPVTITNDAASTRTNLGLGDAATKTVGTASGNIPLVSSLKTVGGSSIIGSGDISTLPSGGTADQVLTSDASSNATWADAAAGGKVLQVVQAVKTDRGSWSGTWQTINGWAATITPSSTSSKILVSINVGSATPLNSNNTLIFRMMRDSTPIAIGDAFGTSPRMTFRTTRTMTDGNHSDGGFQTQVLDSPNTTSAITYTLQGNAEGNATFFVNRNEANASNTETYSGTTHSSIILMEIGA
jgi:hypothetical protein